MKWIHCAGIGLISVRAVTFWRVLRFASTSYRNWLAFWDCSGVCHSISYLVRTCWPFRMVRCLIFKVLHFYQWSTKSIFCTCHRMSSTFGYRQNWSGKSTGPGIPERGQVEVRRNFPKWTWLVLISIHYVCTYKSVSGRKTSLILIGALQVTMMSLDFEDSKDTDWLTNGWNVW